MMAETKKEFELELTKRGFKIPVSMGPMTDLDGALSDLEAHQESKNLWGECEEVFPAVLRAFRQQMADCIETEGTEITGKDHRLPERTED